MREQLQARIAQLRAGLQPLFQGKGWRLCHRTRPCRHWWWRQRRCARPYGGCAAMACGCPRFALPPCPWARRGYRLVGAAYRGRCEAIAGGAAGACRLRPGRFALARRSLSWRSACSTCANFLAATSSSCGVCAANPMRKPACCGLDACSCVKPSKSMPALRAQSTAVRSEMSRIKVHGICMPPAGTRGSRKSPDARTQPRQHVTPLGIDGAHGSHMRSQVPAFDEPRQRQLRNRCAVSIEQGPRHRHGATSEVGSTI